MKASDKLRDARGAVIKAIALLEAACELAPPTNSLIGAIPTLRSVEAQLSDAALEAAEMESGVEA